MDDEALLEEFRWDRVGSVPDVDGGANRRGTRVSRATEVRARATPGGAGRRSCDRLKTKISRAATTVPHL